MVLRRTLWRSSVDLKMPPWRDGAAGHPPPPTFFGSADSKGLTVTNCVSVDSVIFEVLCFECAFCKLVSADSNRVKVVCFDTDSLVSGSVDSRRVSEAVFGSAESKGLNTEYAESTEDTEKHSEGLRVGMFVGCEWRVMGVSCFSGRRM